MKRVNSIILSVSMLTAAFGLFSCKKTQTTSDGMEYTYIKEGKSKPRNGEIVVYQFTARTEKDSTFISTYDQPYPQSFQYNDSTPTTSGIDEIFVSLKKGDSIEVRSTAEKIFGATGLPPFLTNEEKIKINIGVVEVLAEEDFQDYFNSIAEAQQEKQAKEAEVQLEKDVKIIEDYISENNLDATRTESGLFYVIETEGDGPEVNEGDQITASYTGYVLDGTVFDSSEAPFEFQVGVGRVIPGWDEGFQYLKKGSKAKLLIPSTLAYGPTQRSEVIKPNSILIFDVEVTDVQK